MGTSLFGQFLALTLIQSVETPILAIPRAFTNYIDIGQPVT